MCDSHDYLVKICDHIAAEVEKYAENNFWYTDDDGEERHYFDDYYNLDVIYRVGFGIIGVRIMVACGGPNVWVDTEEKAVCGYWGGDTYKSYLTTDTCNQIDDEFNEYYAKFDD